MSLKYRWNRGMCLFFKLLQWEGDGFGMYYKRLEEGTFELPAGFMDGSHSEISSKQLSLILQGVSLKKAFYRKRYATSTA